MGGDVKEVVCRMQTVTCHVALCLLYACSYYQVCPPTGYMFCTLAKVSLQQICEHMARLQSVSNTLYAIFYSLAQPQNPPAISHVA